MKKNWNFGSRKRQLNRSQNGTEKGRKKSHLKNVNFHIFFNKFEENIVFYRGKWASRADSIVFYKEFARPEGQENPGQCGQNLRKTMIFVFFRDVSLGKALWLFWAFKGFNLGLKEWSESDENQVLKKRLVRRRLGICNFRINRPTTIRDHWGQTSWKGGRGDG